MWTARKKDGSKCERCDHLKTFPVACATCQNLILERSPQDACEAVSAELPSYVDKLLNALHKRIQEAGEKGRGCRITAEEAGYLKYYNLPNTTEHISARDE